MELVGMMATMEVGVMGVGETITHNMVILIILVMTMMRPHQHEEEVLVEGEVISVLSLCFFAML